ncbi:unnamed protein product [Sympodiomycopsis kandeliae]
MTSLITVFGATGNQGGSVIQALLQTPYSQRYRIRGVTRDTTKASSQKLAAQGVEVVQANLDDVATVQKAIEGSHGVFGVTNFWESMAPSKEIQQGKNIFEASKAAGVKHLIFSTLPDTRGMTDGKIYVPHFDSKAAIQRHIEATKGEALLATYFQPAFFLQNLPSMIQKSGQALTLPLPISPSAPVPVIDIVADTGKFVVGALDAGVTANGRTIEAASFWIDLNDLAEQFSRVQESALTYTQVPSEAFIAALPEAVAHETAENMKLIDEFSYFGKGAEKRWQANDDIFPADYKRTTLQEGLARIAI